MHTLTLKISDNVLDKITYFLSHLPKKDVEIISDKLDEEIPKDKEITAFSNHSANTINEWKDENEDKIWN